MTSSDKEWTGKTIMDIIQRRKLTLFGHIRCMPDKDSAAGISRRHTTERKTSEEVD